MGANLSVESPTPDSPPDNVKPAKGPGFMALSTESPILNSPSNIAKPVEGPGFMDLLTESPILDSPSNIAKPVKGPGFMALPTESPTFDSPSNITKPVKGPGFMDLPTEIRLQIYEELLVVEKVFYTPDNHDLDNGRGFRDHVLYRKPSLQPLGVNKQLRQEAEEVYLTNNLFVLPYEWWKKYPVVLSKRADNDRRLFAMTAISKIKHISIAISSRTAAPLAFLGRDWDDWEKAVPGIFDSMTPEERREHSHDKCWVLFKYMRHRMWYAILDMSTNLQSIEIDLMNTYCPIGCCRIVEIEWSLLSRLNLKKIRLLGLRSPAELAETRTLTGESPDLLPETCNVEINPVKDEWEQWKMDD